MPYILPNINNLEDLDCYPILDCSLEYKIIIVAGQSNADGRILTTDANTPNYLSDNIIDNVKVWNGVSIDDYDLTDIGDDGNGSSWVLDQSSGKYTFANVAEKLYADNVDNVLICQVTSGGTPLKAVSNERGSWNYIYDNIPEGTPRLLEDLSIRYTNLITYLDSINVRHSTIAMLWHQGEWDDNTSFDGEDEYSENWTGLVNVIRGFVDDDNLPIIYGTISHLSSTFSSIIETAQLDFASNDDNAYCRDNSELTLQDSWHFDALSANKFGEWCAEKLNEL